MQGVQILQPYLHGRPDRLRGPRGLRKLQAYVHGLGRKIRVCQRVPGRHRQRRRQQHLRPRPKTRQKGNHGCRTTNYFAYKRGNSRVHRCRSLLRKETEVLQIHCPEQAAELRKSRGNALKRKSFLGGSSLRQKGCK